jgi:hypothetical protein
MQCAANIVYRALRCHITAALDAVVGAGRRISIPATAEMTAPYHRKLSPMLSDSGAPAKPGLRQSFLPTGEAINLGHCGGIYRLDHGEPGEEIGDRPMCAGFEQGTCPYGGGQRRDGSARS